MQYAKTPTLTGDSPKPLKVDIDRVAVQPRGNQPARVPLGQAERLASALDADLIQIEPLATPAADLHGPREPATVPWDDPGPPSIAQLADDVDADVVVVGAEDDPSWWRRYFAATDEQRVVRRTDRHVLVARALPERDTDGDRRARFRRICVPIRLDPASRAAAGIAAKIAAPEGIVDLVHCIPTSAPAETGAAAQVSATLVEQSEQAAERFFNHLRTSLGARRKLRLGLRYGLMPWALLHHLELAQEAGEPYDLVVVSAEHRGDVARILLGDEAETIVRHATCSALILRPGAMAPVATEVAGPAPGAATP